MQGSIYLISTKKSFSISWNLETSYKDVFSHQEFVLFNNKDILLEGRSIFYKNWFEEAVYLIQDLLDVDGNIMSYTKFTEKYLLCCNFLAHFQVTSAISRNVIERAKVTPMEKTDFLSKNVFPLSSEICVSLEMKNKDFYKLLINKDKIELKASTKWTRDLQVDHIPLESYFGDIKIICKVDNKLREFYIKFLHRMIAINLKELIVINLFLYGKENIILLPPQGFGPDGQNPRRHP